MPEIDSLIISHDHYDHLDATIKALMPKVKRVVTPFRRRLGIAPHWEWMRRLLKKWTEPDDKNCDELTGTCCRLAISPAVG